MSIKSKIRSRYTKRFVNYIETAEAKLSQVVRLQNQLRKSGVLVEGVDYQKVKETLSKYRSYVEKPNYTYKQADRYLERLKDITNRNLLENTIQVKIIETKDLGAGISAPEEKAVTLRKFNKMRKLHSKDPSKVSAQNYDMLSQIANALNPYLNAKAMTTDELKKQAVNRGKVRFDFGIGGDSTLINDLAYSLDANPYGRETVEKIMRLMDGDVGRRVEYLYRTTDLGKEIKRELDGAVGAGWYENFKAVAPTIMKLIDIVYAGVDKTDPDVLDSISNLEEKWSMIGEEGYEEY